MLEEFQNKITKKYFPKELQTFLLCTLQVKLKQANPGSPSPPQPGVASPPPRTRLFPSARSPWKCSEKGGLSPHHQGRQTPSFRIHCLSLWHLLVT